MTASPRTALVLGATGFIGRHLILRLAAEGATVIAACRTTESFDKLLAWLDEHESAAPPNRLIVDFHAPRLAVADDPGIGAVTEIHNCAGAYRFGMSVEEARAANVASVREIVALAATLPRLERLVHVTGYRVAAHESVPTPWSEDQASAMYRQLGAYEASKLEADDTLRTEAQRLGVPWTVINPSTVIGTSTTGESDQYLGLADMLRELWQGTLRAIPGGSDTFIPVVAVDYLARFMALAATDPEAAGHAYWVLDDHTPPLPELLRHIGEHYHVPVPRARLPIAVVKRLPQALTKADPETLSFLSSDRYPTSEARDLARRHDLPMPPVNESLARWADHLAAHRFGLPARAPDLRRRFAAHAGARTFLLGPDAPRALVLPGLPVNADSWAAVAQQAGETTVADLPGLGLSNGDLKAWPQWIDALIAGTGARHLVGHSIGSAVAVEAAHRNPSAIDQLTLVAPFFLQPRPGLIARLPMLTSTYLKHASARTLATRITGRAEDAAALLGTVADLRRPGTTRRISQLLRRAVDPRWRQSLTEQLVGFPGRIHVIVGSQDPLAPWATELLAPLGDRARVTVIDGAGHHPQLTHPAQVAHALRHGLVAHATVPRE
ncbi:alpha/beta fold hydrolase [Lolliginicoccus suaedae]|uniref:alpha/beta fold hydrolase n=1 Tax=Lolliginicoccus suaedae TaxID=2605429 RepID=UPI0011F056E8|nr:alpha/beta fold hydrolase [Lolliginicoccus suaedae]